MKELLIYLNSIYPLSHGLEEHSSDILKFRELPRKTYLLKAGHLCRNICFIKSGLLRCFYIKDNNEVCSWFMKEGDVIVSVESFFQQKESYESIQGIEDCEIYCIEHAQLENKLVLFINQFFSCALLLCIPGFVSIDPCF